MEVPKTALKQIPGSPYAVLNCGTVVDLRSFDSCAAGTASGGIVPTLNGPPSNALFLGVPNLPPAPATAPDRAEFLASDLTTRPAGQP
mmetsp:Transcript_20287/g.56194  ORF Transcript_20287/g.56194 Transcript_20287/m.56194 type:complete len:88 (+) Transcript_20287:152-415(+)